MSVNNPRKTVKIFFNSGSPNGFRTAELSNWTGKAIICPRNQINMLKNYDDANKPSIYFLLSESDDSVIPKLYIGEAENLFHRLKTHTTKNNAWDTVVAFMSKDDNLTKAHVKYLEACCLKIVEKNPQLSLENSGNSNVPALSESAQEETKEFLEYMKILFSALGYSFLDLKSSPSAVKSQKNTLFFIKNQGKNVDATGCMLSKGFIVYKGSKSAKNPVHSYQQIGGAIIKKLLEEKFIADDGDHYLFVKEFIFKTPSSAASFVLLRSENGWTSWKNNEGQTLDQFYRAK